MRYARARGEDNVERRKEKKKTRCLTCLLGCMVIREFREFSEFREFREFREHRELLAQVLLEALYSVLCTLFSVLLSHRVTHPTPCDT